MLFVTPLTDMFRIGAACPSLPAPKNCRLPLTCVSYGLVRMICVVQPPPSAKCGKTIGLLTAVDSSGDTGRVLIKNSPRSFVSPRSAIAPTGPGDEVNVKVPSIGFGALNGP